MVWKKDFDDPLNPEAWASMQKLSGSVSCFTPLQKRATLGTSYIIHTSSVQFQPSGGESYTLPILFTDKVPKGTYANKCMKR